MTLTYGGYNIADYTSKYGVSVVPRTVEGPNAIDSIAGTHEPDPLAQKYDITVRALSGSPVRLREHHDLRQVQDLGGAVRADDRHI